MARYEYGSMGDPRSMGRPGTIDDFMQQRRMYEYGQQLAYERQQQQAADYRYKTALQDREEAAEMRKNRLGLGNLDSMLADRGSAAYQNTYSTGAVDRDGNPVYQTAEEMGIAPVQIDIAPIGEGPMPALGLSPLHGASMRREIRPDFADAKAALRPKNAISANRMTLSEYEGRKAADVRAASEIDTARTQNDMMLKLTDAEFDAIVKSYDIRAKDLLANKPEEAAKFEAAVADFLAKKQGGSQKLDMGGGADDGATVAPATEAPSETPTVSVSAKTMKTIKEGKYVQNEDGSIDFIYNDGRKVPYKK